MKTLSIVVPILNEAQNIALLIERVSRSLQGIEWQLIFVDDDSDDQSRQILIEHAKKDKRVQFISRLGRSGLSSAVIEGALTSPSDLIAVMDGDLQHDEKILPEMVAKLSNGDHDIVIGSRFLSQSSLGEFSASRERMSKVGNWLSQSVIKTNLSDPLSGFFMMKRSVFEEVVRELSGTGFKILLDILSSGKRDLKVVEIPFSFGARLHGESKIDSLVTLEFGLMLLDKWFGRVIPARFILFSAVGGLGIGIHLLILWGLFKVMSLGFLTAQVVATVSAMTINFYLNNALTYRDRRLSGLPFFKGLCSFYLLCSVGALANFQLADFLYSQSFYWAVAGISGAMVGAVWNYAMTSLFTWKKK